VHSRRALVALLALGLAGLGLGSGAAAGSELAAARLAALGAGLCAAASALLGWSGRRAGAGPGADDRVAGPGAGGNAWARSPIDPRAPSQTREQALLARLEAAERAVSDLTGDTVLSARSARNGEVLVDPVTGLYSEGYLLVALEARIAAARRRLRPVSVVMIEVVVGLDAGPPGPSGQPGPPGDPTPADPQLVAAAVRSTLREADTASRTSEGRYVLVLEDTAENGAIWSVERLRARLVGEHPDHTLWAGVACYPAHAFNLDEILHQAGNALEVAKEWRQDRIEVATAE
jgi:GGDEF domain-containing protein